MGNQHLERLSIPLYGDTAEADVELNVSCDEGAGWPLLGIHGYGDNLTTWQILRTMLAERGARFLSFDLPGHGKSPLPPGFAEHYSYNASRLVLAFLERHAPGPLVIVGNSLGGALALGAAALNQERPRPLPIAGLVACAPATLESRTPYFIRLLKLPTYTWLDTLSRRLPATSWQATARTIARICFRAMLAPGCRPDAAWFDSVQASLERPGAWLDYEAIARELLAVLRGRQEEISRLMSRLDELEMPAVILRGDRDRVIGEAELRTLSDTLPEARFESLPGIGHCPQNEAAGRTAEVVLEVARRAGILSDPAASA